MDLFAIDLDFLRRLNAELDLAVLDADHLIAYFGHARLVRTPAGRLEVHGGTDADHADAWDWVRRFLTPAPTSDVAACEIVGPPLPTKRPVGSGATGR